MKQVQVSTKTKARAVMLESLFKPVNGRTLNEAKYCAGKYRPDAFPVGRTLEVNDNVHAIYVRKGKDRDGAFSQLWAISE